LVQARKPLPSWPKAWLAKLSALLPRSGPTIGVGLMSSLNVASLARMLL
jgi:hypothetical protein